MRKACQISLCVLVVVSILNRLKFFDVQAAVSSCTVTVSPSSVNTNTSQGFSFSLQNTDSVGYAWIQVTRPSANFTITGYGVGEWSGGYSASSATFTGSSLAPSDTLDFTVEALSGSSEASSADWSVQVSDDGAGASPFSCTGTLGTAITAGEPEGDTTPPTISDLAVSDVSQTSVKITWTTDEASNSEIDYGTTEDYGSTGSDATMTTSHSITITGLTANTTYHYNVKSTDATSNEAEAGDNTFVSSQAATTSTTTVTTTTTTTTTVTKIVKDETNPEVSLTTKFEETYSEAPTITGKASDNVGVSKVEYSTDDGKNWLMADNLAEIGAENVTFEFEPIGLTDGNYEIRARATDPSGNKTTSKVYTLVIDRLPPQAGPAVFSLGPLVFKPDKNGQITVLKNLNIKITLSAVGGPINLDVNVSKKETEETQNFTLSKNIENGLWSGVINFSVAGEYELTVNAVDGAGNVTERTINSVKVLAGGTAQDNGMPLADVEIQVFTYQSALQDFISWDGSVFGQTNPQKTEGDGTYGLFLPPGKYYLEVSLAGYRKQVTEMFDVSETLPITMNFELGKASKLEMIPIVGTFLDMFSSILMPVDLTYQDQNPTEMATNQEFPNFDLRSGNERVDLVSVLGRPTVISFVATWLPGVDDQLTEIKKFEGQVAEVNVIVVGVHDTESKLDIFKKRGDYELRMVADPDGALVEPLTLKSLPTHVFLDRKGVIKNEVVGFLDSDSILTNLMR